MTARDPDHIEISRQLSAWHFEWVEKHGFDLDDDEATPEAIAEYVRRSREILGQDSETGLPVDPPPSMQPTAPAPDELLTMPADRRAEVLDALTDEQIAELREKIRRGKEESRRAYGGPVPRESPPPPDIDLED